MHSIWGYCNYLTVNHFIMLKPVLHLLLELFMKNIKILPIFFSFVFLGTILAQLYTLTPTAYASTEDANYTFYYKDSDTNALKAIFDHGEKWAEIGDKMVITAQGDIFGNKGYKFAFDAGVNKRLNEWVDDDSSDNYYAVSRVYCADNKLTLTKPTKSNEGYIEEIEYTLGFHADDWDDMQNNNSQELYAGVTRVYKMSTKDGVADKETYLRGHGTGQKINPTLLGNDDDSGGKGGNPKNHIDPGCWKALNNGRIGDVKNYYKLSATAKAKVDKIVVAGASVTAPSGGSGSSPEDPQADCDAKLNSTLSWILCPVIDLGVNMSDYVFKNFVEPFMENVPISTDPRDGSYKAWQQFRILANVMLIGTLLAIVYAQVKGDK